MTWLQLQAEYHIPPTRKRSVVCSSSFNSFTSSVSGSEMSSLLGETGGGGRRRLMFHLEFRKQLSKGMLSGEELDVLRSIVMWSLGGPNGVDLRVGGIARHWIPFVQYWLRSGPLGGK